MDFVWWVKDRFLRFHPEKYWWRMIWEHVMFIYKDFSPLLLPHFHLSSVEGGSNSGTYPSLSPFHEADSAGLAHGNGDTLPLFRTEGVALWGNWTLVRKHFSMSAWYGAHSSRYLCLVFQVFLSWQLPRMNFVQEGAMRNEKQNKLIVVKWCFQAELETNECLLRRGGKKSDSGTCCMCGPCFDEN